MWFPMISIIIMIALILYRIRAMPFKMRGVKLKTVMIYASIRRLNLCILLLWTLVFLFKGNDRITAIALVLGFIVAIPFYFNLKRKINNKVEGHTFYMGAKQNLQAVFWIVLVTISLVILFFIYIQSVDQLFAVARFSISIYMAWTLAWALAELLAVRFIARLEDRLGSSILGAER
jgi:hypothetical protein